ncbi:MAG TPA: quinoprotein dehydrogenase-associated putative ABC transporter substrate-binding protein [Casimicrobiaceae bacterium]|jgi:mxaJ protein|nr:quinoprotein dehydrogenase-associated putative ABC transporter substrate-binding protein [Casimicrobiaceae bacterium]
MSSRCRNALACTCALVLWGVAAASSARELRVCADPDNLPYSDRAQRGFENRIVKIVARDMGADVAYYWLPQWRGYARKTLERGHCDLIPGIARDDDSVLATDAYYTGTFALVYAPTRFPALTSLDDPRLRSLRIGIQVIGIEATPSPPARALARRGIVDNVVGFPVMGTTPSAQRIVDAIAAGSLDVGIVWSPQPGYFIAQRHLPLDVVSIRHSPRDPSFEFAIAMGVRRDDAALQREVNASLARLKPAIDGVLREYAVARADQQEVPR